MGELAMIILGIFCFAGALFLSVKPYLPGALFAYFGLWFFYWSHTIWISPRSLLYWGITTMIVIGLEYMQQERKKNYSEGSIYLILGAISGALIGLSIGALWLIPACAIGTAIATIAYGKTPKGKSILFSGSTFIQYFCSHGLRIIVVASMIGLVIGAYLVTNATLESLPIY